MWIFSEDFEGCGNTKEALRVSDMHGITFNPCDKHGIIFSRNHADTWISVWQFGTLEQAQAAYDKIKTMLKEGK